MDCISCKTPLKATPGGRPLALNCLHILCEKCFKHNTCSVCGVKSPEPAEKYVAENIMNILRQISAQNNRNSVIDVFHCKKHPRKEAEFYCKYHKEFLCAGCAFQHMDHKDSIVSYSYESLQSDFDALHQIAENLKNECNQVQESLAAAGKGQSKDLVQTLAQSLKFAAQHSGNGHLGVLFPSGQENKPDDEARLLRGNIDSAMIKLSDVDKLLGQKDDRNLELLYRGSRDGFAPEDFHRCCDGKGPTLSVISLYLNGKKAVVGGYTVTPWASSAGFQPANAADFVFRLDPLTVLKYNIQVQNYQNAYQNQYGTCHHDEHGPRFGNSDLVVYENKVASFSTGHYCQVVQGSIKDYPRMIPNVMTFMNYEDIEVFAVR